MKRKKDRRKNRKSAAPEKVVDSPKDERPRKRPKLLSDNEQDLPVGDSKSNDRPDSPEVRRSPTPLATLPSFPLPALPNPPPKSVLALQGIDQALLDAEIVDPTTVLPIDSDVDVDCNTGLGKKSRKRLKELGIIELFAGELSFLIVRWFCYFLIKLPSSNRSSTFSSSPE